MIRVLQVLSSLNKGSGIANVVMNYYRNINKEEVQFDFLCFWKADSNYEEEVKELGGRVFYFTKPTIKNYFKGKNELKEFFAEHKNEYIIVHNHEILLAKMLFPIAKKNGAKICISHAHNTKFSDSKFKAVRNKLACLNLAKASDYCFACSDLAAEKMFGKSVLKSEKYKLIYNAIDQERFKFDENIRQAIREKLNLENNFVIGHVGRFAPQKNHKFLIEVFKNVKEQIPTAKLMLLGDGGLKDKVREQVQKLGLTNDVLFLGNVSNVNEYLNAMDLFVLPSVYEGLGMVAIEAQINKLSCLLSITIPKEVYVLASTKFLPLSKEQWSNLILEFYCDRKYERGYRESIHEDNYDIRSQSSMLTKIYLMIGGVNE